jgi:hypothetical protein
MRLVQSPLKHHFSRLWFKPEEVIWHWSAGSTLGGAISTLNQKKLSYHYLIDRDGTVHQLVDENRTAYHSSGGGVLQGVSLVNFKSIGICCIGMDGHPITDEQYHAARELWFAIQHRRGITKFRRHSAVKPTACPGTLDIAWITAPPVAAASSEPQFQEGFPFDVRIGSVRTNIRTAPNLGPNNVRKYEPGHQFRVIGSVAGERINNQDQWYILEDTHEGGKLYVWTGALTGERL